MYWEEGIEGHRTNGPEKDKALGPTLGVLE